MYPKILVSSGRTFGQAVITIQELSDRNTIAWSVSWPISYFESCDWATWAAWASYTEDARAIPMAEGWMLSIPLEQIANIDYQGMHLHDSHRRKPGSDTEYQRLALVDGYRTNDVPYIF